MSKRSYATVAIWLLSLIGLLALFLLKVFRKSPTSSTEARAEATTGPKATNPFNPIDKKIIQSISGFGYSAEMGRMWAAVSRHETDTYKSELFLKANNLFGMTKPKQRLWYGNGVYKIGSMEYSSYATPDTSILDLIEYLRAVGYPYSFASAADLVAYMKAHGYFSDTLENYTRGVEYHLSKI